MSLFRILLTMMNAIRHVHNHSTGAKNSQRSQSESEIFLFKDKIGYHITCFSYKFALSNSHGASTM